MFDIVLLFVDIKIVWCNVDILNFMWFVLMLVREVIVSFGLYIFIVNFKVFVNFIFLKIVNLFVKVLM